MHLCHNRSASDSGYYSKLSVAREGLINRSIQNPCRSDLLPGHYIAITIKLNQYRTVGLTRGNIFKGQGIINRTFSGMFKKTKSYDSFGLINLSMPNFFFVFFIFISDI